MRIQKALIVYKKSRYQKFILEGKTRRYRELLRQQHKSVVQWLPIHEEHNETLEQVQATLRRLSIPYQRCSRYRIRTPIRADLVITVGGDGTFLEAAHHVQRHVMFGVNSTPESSVGHFTAADVLSFEKKLRQLISGKARFKVLQRLQAYEGQKKLGPPALNEILFTSQNAGATSRYWICQIKGKRRSEIDEQKSSGLWIATPSGSTAAIRSAGAKPVAMESVQFLYLVREHYREPGKKHSFVKGNLGIQDQLKVIPKMDDAALFIDGAHVVCRVHRGKTITFRLSSQPITIVA